jgi:stage V sporulation protein G
MKKATEKKESGLELTKISIYPVKSKTAGNLKASVDLTFNNLLVCKGFKVIEGSSGFFVSKPTSKGSDGKYYDQVYVLSKSEWDEIADIILEEYDKGVK